MSNNGQKGERKCPYGLECDKCHLSIEMMNMSSGTPQKFNMCSLVATATMLSEINQKTPQQKVNIPTLYRG